MPVRRVTAVGGSIPARAGNPPSWWLDLLDGGVHPRACGESQAHGRRQHPLGGPSPRVRGIRSAEHPAAERRRSIPARAGNPRSVRVTESRAGVHPRACGESGLRGLRRALRRGPSPRVRGILARRAEAERPAGSIPARAGNPPRSSAASSRHGVHPRACGESVDSPLIEIIETGPSPRVRGIPRPGRRSPSSPRSIPARAGNPWSPTSRSTRTTVHPRACGESYLAAMAQQCMAGPSPRVRGIRQPGDAPPRRPGSIPARAGNPAAVRAPARASGVHPRACGESLLASPFDAPLTGPSPRVRGIPPADRDHAREAGSIPARAGNPRPAGERRRRRGVHPRACGESICEVDLLRTDPGPSPRVRGIRCARRTAARLSGSIPARAGNPTPRDARRRARGVHPRACGESHVGRPSGAPSAGPSPRVRGIPRRRAR